MVALRNPASNMFSDRPKDTIEAVLAAARLAVTGQAGPSCTLSALGVSSFSSGIGAMRLFLQQFGPTGLIQEIYDFDSPYIKKEPKELTSLPPGSPQTARLRTFTQVDGTHPQVGYVVVTEKHNHFANVTEYGGEKDPRGRTHHRIGWMMYYLAMVNSVLA